MDDKVDILSCDNYLNFETVYINTSYEKLFEVKNNSSISQVYTAERYVSTPKLESGFKVKPAVSESVTPGRSVWFKIEVVPRVANMKISDYFVIKHSFGVEAILFAMATVEGPECSLSCTRFQMICPHETTKCTKKFSIRNCGSYIAAYQIVVDNKNSKIMLSPSQGKIRPSKSVEIFATFTSKDLGDFFKRVFVLVEHHEPLVLDIYATRSRNNDSPFVSVQTEVPQFKNGYNCFMNNLVRQRADEPMHQPISMDVHYINFKHCHQKCKKEMTFSMTNNRNDNVVVIWNLMFQKVFSIQPSKLELDSKSTSTFKAIFQTPSKDELYNADIEAQLFVNSQVLPFPVSISLNGHSFDELSCGWAAQYRVDPSRVVLPPITSSPFRPSHSTLTIHRIGHLPLAFRFHPPETTNFTVKPQQGLIQKEFQIVLVQFDPKSTHDMICVEKWMLSFNSNEYANHCYVEFSGSVETPQLIVNNGNDVVFPKVHPQSPFKLDVDLYNPTRFSFWFSEEVLRGDSVLMVGHGGEIWPNEHKKVTWTFCPQGVGELEALVCCTPSLGADVQVKAATVLVKCICEETTLQVMPHGLIYEKALCGCEHERGFEITNCGEAIVSGTFMWLTEESPSNCDVDIRFDPETFTLRPGSSTLINVTATPHGNGNQRITIGYSTNEISATPIIPVFVNGLYPFLQVTDIRVNNSGPLFTKLDFLKTLQISKLNSILEKLRPNETVSTNLHLPSFLCGSDVITVELLVENLSDIVVDLNLTQEKSCDCQPERKTVSFSRSRLKVNCPHKSQIRVSPTSTRLEAYSVTVLQLDVSFNAAGYVESLFSLTVNPEDYANIHSTIKLNVDRFAIPEEASFLDSVESKVKEGYIFNMKSVYIGDCYAFVQAFYIYNNTKRSVSYEINDEHLFGTPFKYVGNRDTVSPLSNHALMFTFLPNSCETYESFVELRVDSKIIFRIVLQGTGLREKVNDDDEKLLVYNEEKLMSLKPVPVYLSVSHINVGPMKQICAQRNVLFLNNKTKDVLSFKWHVTKLPMLVEVRVHPNKGAVQPGGAAECRVVTYSKGRPCDLTCTLTCLCASFSKYQAMVQKVFKYREDLAKSADYFVITERGEESVELVPPYEEWPRKSYLTVSVRVDVKYDAQADQSLHLCAPTSLQTPHSRESFSDMDEGQKLELTHIMETVLWEAVNGLCADSSFKKEECLERYATFRDSSDYTDVAVPPQVLLTTMEDVLYSVWRDVFQLTPRNSTDYLRRTLINCLQQYSRSQLNLEDIIGHEHCSMDLFTSHTK